MINHLRRSCMVLLVGLVAQNTSLAQAIQPEISTLSNPEGLSQNTITCMVQDSYGFLWVGTQDGLNKYDGYTFKTFTSKPNDSTTISNNFIKAIVSDSENNLWIATQVGLTKYHSTSGLFRRFLLNEPEDSSFQSHVINDLLIDGRSLWIATDDGLVYVEDVSRPDFKKIPDLVTSEDFTINQMVKDAAGNIWMATNQYGICVYNTKTQKSQQLNSGVSKDLHRNLRCIAFFNDLIWVGAKNGLFSLDPEQVSSDSATRASEFRVETYVNPVQDISVISISKDSRGVIWAGSQSKGVFTLDMKTKTLNPYVIGYKENPKAFESTAVTEIFEDYSDNIWIGTLETGLFKIRRSLKQFRLLRTMMGKSDELSSNRVRGLLETNEHLWVGTAKGLNKLDKKTRKRVQAFEHDSRNRYSISDNDVKTLDVDQLGNVWVATNNGLNRLQKSTQKFDRFYSDPDHTESLIHDNKVRAVKVMKTGLVWIGSLGGGITIIDPQTLKLVKSFRLDKEDTSSLSNNNVMSIHESSNGDIWVATYGGGLNKLKKDGTGFERILQDTPQIPKLLTSIHEGPAGELWIGSYGDGFYKLNTKDYSWQAFTEEQGLSNNVVYAAIPYNDEIWLSTNLGLCVMDPEAGLFREYNENDGVQSNEFNSGSFLKSSSGELFFGGINGLTSFFPDSIKTNTEPPPLAFTDFRIFNSSVTPGEVVLDGDPPLRELISDSTQVRLSHLHNLFTIEFAALDYSSPMDTRYAYQLVGFDKDWIFSDARQRAITYTNLLPGSYTFRMKATNDDGVWNNEPIVLFIEILPAVWQRWWFKLFVASLIVAALAGIVYRRVTKTERRRKFLEQKINEHTKEISSQNEILIESENHLRNVNRKKDLMFYALAHHVRGPITTLFSLLKSYDDDETENGKTKETYFRELNLKVGQSLLLLDNTYYWSLLQFDQLRIQSEETDVLKLVHQSLNRHQKAINAKGITSTIENDKDYIVQSDRKILSLILENLISNAVKFSLEKGVITIRIIENKNTLRITVEDKGVGLSKEELENLFDDKMATSSVGTRNEKGTGLGLPISYRLAKETGLNLGVEQENSVTRFNLDIPLNSE